MIIFRRDPPARIGIWSPLGGRQSAKGTTHKPERFPCIRRQCATSANPRPRSPFMASRIEDYALIGDCETAALVSRDGSIDWLCWPRFDSEACFAALLGDSKNGRWRIAPVSDMGSG